MDFNHRYYVPVIKIKQNEKTALSRIRLDLRPSITPLLEVVERKPEKNINQHLDTAFNKLLLSTAGYSRCFLDAREIAADGEAGARQVFDRASALGINFTPVTGISRSVDRVPALEHATSGIALRVSRAELEGHTLPSSLPAYLFQNSLTFENVDLILDLGAVDTMVVPGITSLMDEFLASVPSPTRWRTLIISACAFPVSMGGVERNSSTTAPRRDWIAWRDHLYARRNDLPRLPIFSDCGIQHTSGVEGFDPRRMQVSASIRYTRPEDWLLIKGQGTRTKSPSEQFPDLAKQLVLGDLASSYRGPRHCRGCADIWSAAHGNQGFGSSGAWRRIGTIHHITEVMENLGLLHGL